MMSWHECPERLDRVESDTIQGQMIKCCEIYLAARIGKLGSLPWLRPHPCPTVPALEPVPRVHDLGHKKRCFADIWSH